MGRIIALSNHKGGVGKTTSVVNIGAALNKLNKRILLVDMDPQANLTQSLGVENPENTIYEALKGENELDPIEIQENFHLIASTLDLSGAEMELSNEAGREFLLAELLNPIKDNYDYILIDCPPSLGLLTINSLACADDLFIPLQPHYLAIKGLTKIIEVKEKVKKRINKKIEITGVFITLYDKRKVLHRDVVETINTYFDSKVFNARIRDNISLAEAPSVGLDIFRYCPTCYGSIDYMLLSKEILKRFNDK